MRGRPRIRLRSNGVSNGDGGRGHVRLEEGRAQTSLIRASLIRMSHNPYTRPANRLYHFLFTMIQ